MTTRNMLKTALLVLLVPAAAAAQERPALEIGTKAGFLLSRAEFGGQTETLKAFNLPTGSLYLAFFPSDNVFVESDLSLDWISDDDDSATALGMTGWVNFAPSGVTVNSPYIGAGPSLQYASFGDDSDSEWGASGRVGYRSIVRETLAIRIEAGFTRWFDAELNVFSLQVAFGGLLNRAT